VKVQDLLASYLYQHKTLTLPGIGTFELNPAVNVYELKDDNWPADTITFTPNRSAVADDSFLLYLVEHSGKMKILAQSDLDSFINNGLQLLNIGKPFQLNGIGLISRGGQGGLSFEQGSPATHGSEGPGSHYILKDRTKEKPVDHQLDFSSEERKSSRKPFLILAGILALALIGWAIYLAIPKKENAPAVTEADETVTDTVAVLPPADTTTQSQAVADSTTTTLPSVDTSRFRLQIRQFTSLAAAESKAAQMKSNGHAVQIVTVDSTNHLLVLEVNKPLRDTTYVIDSLRKWYLWKATLFQANN
jgi:hypothetical protein